MQFHLTFQIEVTLQKNMCSKVINADCSGELTLPGSNCWKKVVFVSFEYWTDDLCMDRHKITTSFNNNIVEYNIVKNLFANIIIKDTLTTPFQQIECKKSRQSKKNS
jgi:hypothetical protein